METPRPLKWWWALALLGWLAACGAPRPEAVLSPTPTLAAPLPPSPSATPSLAPSPTTPRVTPSLAPTPQRCWSAGGRWERHRLEVPETPWPLDFRIYLPPCYDEQPRRRYPVLYLIHGQNFTDDQWQRLGVGQVLDRLVPAGELPPFLIVLPRDRVWTQPSEDGFGDAVRDELIPWVDAHYRTLPERPYRAVGGLSRGASWAFHLGFGSWRLFGAVGGHSPPVFWDDVRVLRQWLAAIPPGQWPRIWLDIGDGDRQEIMASARWLEGVLTEMGIPHEWHLFAGRHDEAYWAAHVEMYLRWYAAPWSAQPSQSGGGGRP